MARLLTQTWHQIALNHSGLGCLVSARDLDVCKVDWEPWECWGGDATGTTTLEGQQGKVPGTGHRSYPGLPLPSTAVPNASLLAIAATGFAARGGKGLCRDRLRKGCWHRGSRGDGSGAQWLWGNPGLPCSWLPPQSTYKVVPTLGCPVWARDRNASACSFLGCDV